MYEACRPGIIIIDPYQSFLPEGLHISNLGEMRRIIGMMMRFAARREVTLLLIGHLNKNEGSKDIHRGYGSGDIAAAMRNIIKIEIDKKDPSIRTLKVIKSNLDGACFEPIGIRQDEDNKLELYDPVAEADSNQIDLAAQIILDLLENGKVPLDLVNAEFKRVGIQDRTGRRARERANVIKKKIGEINYLVSRGPKPPK